MTTFGIPYTAPIQQIVEPSYPTTTVAPILAQPTVMGAAPSSAVPFGERLGPPPLAPGVASQGGGGVVEDGYHHHPHLHNHGHLHPSLYGAGYGGGGIGAGLGGGAIGNVPSAGYGGGAAIPQVAPVIPQVAPTVGAGALVPQTQAAVGPLIAQPQAAMSSYPATVPGAMMPPNAGGIAGPGMSMGAGGGGGYTADGTYTQTVPNGQGGTTTLVVVPRERSSRHRHRHHHRRHRSVSPESLYEEEYPASPQNIDPTPYRRPGHHLPRRPSF